MQFDTEDAIILRMPANTEGRDFVVGDTHGCYLELMTLLDHVSFDLNKDRLFSVGDLIDRGPDNLSMLDLLYEPWFYTVLGNHDEFMKMYFTMNTGSYVGQTWFSNGGKWILNDDIDQSVLRVYAQRMINLPDVIHVDGVGPSKFNIVHAEMIGEIPLSDENLETADISVERTRWGRSFCNRLDEKTEKWHSKDLSIVYCGHNTVDNIHTFLKHIDIDTACTYGYAKRVIFPNPRLTLVHPASGKAYSCKAITFEIEETCLRATINKLSNTDNIFVEAPVKPIKEIHND